MKMYIRVLVTLVVIAAAPDVSGFAQTPATRRVMRQKLGHSQKILEAILSSNFALLDAEGAALAKITEDPGWTALKGPEYLKQSEDFLSALRTLRDAARDRDLDAAAQRYNALTTTCFACHRYMKDRRIAR